MYHRFFLVPERFKLSQGEITTIHCRLTDDFTQSDGAISPERINICGISNKNEYNIEIKDFYVKNKTLLFDAPILKEGLYFIELILKTRIIDLPIDKFTSYLMHENLAEILNLIDTQRLHKDIYKERYTHHAKTIIEVGSKGHEIDFRTSHPHHKLEIIPDANPFSLRAGDILTVKVLYEGTPLSFASVSYGDSKHPYTTQSDENGSAKIKLWKPGSWFIHAIHMIPSGQSEDIDWESFWGTFVFEVGGNL